MIGRTMFLVAVSCTVGALAQVTYDRWPQKPEAYTVQLKDACVRPEGVEVSFTYDGVGRVVFTIVPPESPAGQKEDK